MSRTMPLLAVGGASRAAESAGGLGRPCHQRVTLGRVRVRKLISRAHRCLNSVFVGQLLDRLLTESKL